MQRQGEALAADPAMRVRQDTALQILAELRTATSVLVLLVGKALEDKDAAEAARRRGRDLAAHVLALRRSLDRL